MDYQKQIAEILDQALTEKSFSLEIIDKIKVLKDGFKESQDTNDYLSRRVENLETGNKELQGTVDNLRDRNKKLEDASAAVDTERKAQEKVKYELEFQKQRANEMKEIVGMVFANPVVFTERCKSVPVRNGSGYIETYSESESERKRINKHPNQ